MASHADEAGLRVLDAAVVAAQDVLGGELEAVYALGSLAHGGFAPLVSDVDVAIVVAAIDDKTPGRIAEVERLTKSRCPTQLAERLSIFWADWEGVHHANGGRGRLGEVDRLDLLESGRLLIGTDRRAGAIRPAPASLIISSAELAVTKFDETYLRQLNDPADLVAQGARAVTKAVLFPVRFMFTLHTHQIGLNDAAADWYVRQGDHDDLVRTSLEWRQNGITDESRAIELLDGHLVGLYNECLHSYIRGLTDTGIGSMRLIENLRARQRMLADLAGQDFIR
jgi:hypothetical protein